MGHVTVLFGFIYSVAVINSYLGCSNKKKKTTTRWMFVVFRRVFELSDFYVAIIHPQFPALLHDAFNSAPLVRFCYIFVCAFGCEDTTNISQQSSFSFYHKQRRQHATFVVAVPPDLILILTATRITGFLALSLVDKWVNSQMWLIRKHLKQYIHV